MMITWGSKKWWSRVPAIVLASIALLVSLSVPVRAVVAVRAGESEIIEVDEGKFVQQQTCHTRRHRRAIHKEPRFFCQPDDEDFQVAFPIIPEPPLSFWTTTPPLLRAPPARV